MADSGKERNLLNPLPSLLLIDDDQISREVIATVLAMSGYSVTTAADGAAALQLLEAGECAPDAILMDAQMPGLSGVRLISELRARSHAGVCAISASRASEEVLAAADGFLLKPFGAAELRELLAEQRASFSTTPVLYGDEPVVDPAVLAQLRGMMPEAAVKKIYAAIVADLDKKLTAIEAALAEGDLAEVRRIGHAIKGGCAMAGARQAVRLGALLESDSLEDGGNHLDNISPLLCDLRAAARNLERMLNGEFKA